MIELGHECTNKKCGAKPGEPCTRGSQSGKRTPMLDRTHKERPGHRPGTSKYEGFRSQGPSYTAPKRTSKAQGPVRAVVGGSVVQVAENSISVPTSITGGSAFRRTESHHGPPPKHHESPSR